MFISEQLKNSELPEGMLRIIEEAVESLQDCYQPDNWADDNNLEARQFMNDLENIINKCELISNYQKEKYKNTKLTKGWSNTAAGDY